MPAALLIFLFGLLIYIGTFFLIKNQLIDHHVDQQIVTELGRNVNKDFSNLTPKEFSDIATNYSAQTALTTFFVLAGVMLMVFAAPPIEWLTGGAPIRDTWLPTIAAAVLIVAYIILLSLPNVRTFFDLVALPNVIKIGIVVLTLIWMLVQRAAWRSRYFERFLGLEESMEDV